MVELAPIINTGVSSVHTKDSGYGAFWFTALTELSVEKLETENYISVSIHCID